MTFLLLALMTVTNAADLARHLMSATDRVAFDLTATVTRRDCGRAPILQVSDASGAVTLHPLPEIAKTFPRFRPGDVIRVRGKTVLQQYGIYLGQYEDLRVLRHESPPDVPTATVGEIKRGRYDHRPVFVEGTIHEAFRDETDSQFLYMVLVAGDDSIYVTSMTDTPMERIQSLVGNRVRLCGACQPITTGFRHIMGRTLALNVPEDIMRLDEKPVDLFDAPPMREYGYEFSPEAFLRMGRRRLTGRVRAVFAGNRLLIADAYGPHVVALATDDTPDPGEAVEVVGQPETDLYHVNLSHAIWRRRHAESSPPAANTGRQIVMRQLFSDIKGQSAINPELHSILLSLSGTVHDCPAAESPHDILTLKDGEYRLSVDIGKCRSATAGLAVGTRIAVTGVCVVERENWHAYSQFPHVTGIRLVPRSADDIRILARPPWWTPARLLSLVGFLLAVLLGILIWNAALRRAAARRGRELFRAQIDKASTELRVGERTRLAVELHDTISQNLTGISMQVDSAGRFLDTDRDRARRTLALASRAVDACRAELRNCIWDLRSRVLEEPRLDRAIEKALQGTVGSARLLVRFDLARTKLSDPTAHAILRIVRELATNAIRHGRARTIRIAGAAEGGRLLISVRDDGCGFDPKACPGVAEGHFGLQGIRERIRPFDGTLTVDSAPGRGTRVAIVLSKTP